MNQSTRQCTSQGFSLVELMVAMTLGLLMTAAIGTLFVANKTNYRQNTLIAEMQDNSRFAMQALARDIGMAGFMGGMTDIGAIARGSGTLPAIASDCGPGADGSGGWALDTAPLEVLNQPGAGATATYSCLGDESLVPAADVVTIRHVAGLPAAELNTSASAATLRRNTFYLQTNRTTGSLFFSGADAEAPDTSHAPRLPPKSIWEYESRLYFVRDYSQTPGDGIPALCRRYLVDQAGPRTKTECVAEGVENFQIAIGVDTDDDGIVNRYDTDPAVADLARAVTARIQLLMRSTAADPAYRNDKRYDLHGHDDDGDGAIDESGDGYTPDDRFYRRLVQTTINLHNPALASGNTP